MERRDHSGASAPDPRQEAVVAEAAPRARFRQFEFRRPERQLDVPRVSLAVLLMLGLLSVASYLGWEAVQGALRWLHQQPQYQVPFREIRLRPDPPRWFRGGAAAFLEQVRERAKESEIVSVLDLESGRLRRAFRDYSPWVQEVGRIEFPPQMILVELTYKQPVATTDQGATCDVFLDRNGHLLPQGDLDLDKLGRLIRITGQRLFPSPENRPGGIWRSSLPGAESARIERCLRGAAGLAGFLKDPEREADAASNPALHIRSVFATDSRGLFLRTDEDVQVLWGDPPGQEPVGGLDALAKWEIMKNWAKLPSRRRLPPGGFWTFSRDELRPVEPLGSGS
jgi:hypothetical protein